MCPSKPDPVPDYFFLASIPYLVSFRINWNIKHILPFLSRYNIHKEAADEERAYNARMKPVWDAEAAQKKAVVNREEMIKLAKETGTPVSWGYSATI